MRSNWCHILNWLIEAICLLRPFYIKFIWGLFICWGLFPRNFFLRGLFLRSLFTPRSLLLQKQKGGFHLVDLLITELKGYKTCYRFECSHWWKNFLLKKRFALSSLNAVISTNERNWILTDHVTFKLPYD